jgi:uncharacterized protein
MSTRRSFVSRISRAATVPVLLLSLPLSLHRLAQAQNGTLSLKDIRERGVVMQNWESSCAAAAVATVMTYGFGDPVSERSVALEMLKQTDPVKVKSEGGFSLLDMKRFAQARGYEAAAYMNLSFEEMRVFHAPILLIETKGYRHYVVFNGVKGKQALIADPAFGNREIDIDSLQEQWLDGIAFVLTKATVVRQLSP